MRNIFAEKSYAKCGADCKPFAFPLYQAFLKNKKRSGTSLPVSFSASFLKKNISLVIFFLTDQISLSDCLNL